MPTNSDVKDFFDKVEKDPKLQQQLKKNFSSLVSLAKKNGFTFSQQEMLEHLQKRWGVKKAPKFDVDTCTG